MDSIPDSSLFYYGSATIVVVGLGLLFKFRKEVFKTLKILIKSWFAKKKKLPVQKGGINLTTSNSGGINNLNIFIVTESNMGNLMQLLKQQKNSKDLQ